MTPRYIMGEFSLDLKIYDKVLYYGKKKKGFGPQKDLSSILHFILYHLLNPKQLPNLSKLDPNPLTQYVGIIIA